MAVQEQIIYGLIGFPLEHSFSPQYFAEKFKKEKLPNHHYQLFEVESLTEVKQIFETKGLKGLNVTIPYKKEIIPYLDGLSVAAQKTQAVNVINIVKGKFIGHNTDYIGFQKSLKYFLSGAKIENALILGSGGSSSAVELALNNLNINTTIVSRKAGTNNLTYNELDRSVIESNRLIINTTPLGMYPQINKKPDIPLDFISKNHFIFDLIYNPEKTLFLKSAEDKGAKIKNGLEMLYLQAEEAWKIWNNTNS
ncbi:MAG: shikimate dehydrogenase [Chitinophagaceae bacterium]|nr:MAG: shikimate dehydrogenase [Chitinophagaceae bacterium]